jgi:hypothetical protein
MITVTPPRSAYGPGSITDAASYESVYEPARRAPNEIAGRRVPHDEAKRIAQRLIRASFRRDGERLPVEATPRFSIPCRPEHDDDCLILAYIEQNEAKIDALVQLVDALVDLAADSTRQLERLDQTAARLRSVAQIATGDAR